jgi:uncharacterized protein
MRKPLVIAFIALTLVFPGRADAQAARDPDAIAAARDLVSAMRLIDQFKLILPRTMMQVVKPAMLAGRPQLEREFDVMSAVVLEGMSTRVEEVTDQIVEVYARHFTGDELRQVTAFYRTPTGQKLLEEMPALMQESMTIGQNFGRTIGAEMQNKVNEELRKRGIKP